MSTYRDFVTALEKLGIPANKPVIAHASLSAFGQVRGGAITIVAALSGVFPRVMMPTFTYKTMVIPETGPAGNALTYGEGRDRNRMTEFFTPDMPADPLMGIVPETLRQAPDADRSSHPILSFAGIGVKDALDTQSLLDPLAPIEVLAQQGGWVVLLGVGHTVNTSIHYAEQLSGRQGFTRWALTRTGIQRCMGFPGCSNGFGVVGPFLGHLVKRGQLGQGVIQAYALNDVISTAMQMIQKEPMALLCARRDCTRCRSVRARVNA